jgi:hypothetical protein
MNISITKIPFSVAEATSQLTPLVILVIGITLYAVFVFKFYRFLAKKDIFELNLYKYNQASHPIIEKFFAVILYFIEYIIIFPLFIVFWFLMLTGFLSLLTKVSLANTVMLSMALVAAIRITAFYNEDLSKDLAKMIPFALLGVFLIDFKYMNMIDLKNFIPNLILMWKTIFYYLLLAMILETILRVMNSFFNLFRKQN